MDSGLGVNLPGRMSPKSWACAMLEIRLQLISGMESLWKAGRVVGFVLESLNFRLIPITPAVMRHSLQLSVDKVRA